MNKLDLSKSTQFLRLVPPFFFSFLENFLWWFLVTPSTKRYCLNHTVHVLYVLIFLYVLMFFVKINLKFLIRKCWNYLVIFDVSISMQIICTFFRDNKYLKFFVKYVISKMLKISLMKLLFFYLTYIYFKISLFICWMKSEIRGQIEQPRSDELESSYFCFRIYYYSILQVSTAF